MVQNGITRFCQNPKYTRNEYGARKHNIFTQFQTNSSQCTSNLRKKFTSDLPNSNVEKVKLTETQGMSAVHIKQHQG